MAARGSQSVAMMAGLRSGWGVGTISALRARRRKSASRHGWGVAWGGGDWRDVAGERGSLDDGCRETGKPGGLRYARCGEISGDQRGSAVLCPGEAGVVCVEWAQIAALTSSATRAKARSVVDVEKSKRSRVSLRAGEAGGEGARVAAKGFGEEGGGAVLLAEAGNPGVVSRAEFAGQLAQA